MCPPVSTDIRETVESLSLPQQFADPMIDFGEQLIRRLQPQCIILYGSLARNTYTVASDIECIDANVDESTIRIRNVDRFEIIE